MQGLANALAIPDLEDRLTAMGIILADVAKGGQEEGSSSSPSPPLWDSVLATVFALFCLELRFEDRREVWRMVAEKAKAFVKRATGKDVDDDLKACAALVDTAIEFLKE